MPFAFRADIFTSGAELSSPSSPRSMPRHGFIQGLSRKRCRAFLPRDGVICLSPPSRRCVSTQHKYFSIFRAGARRRRNGAVLPLHFSLPLSVGQFRVDFVASFTHADNTDMMSRRYFFQLASLSIRSRRHCAFSPIDFFTLLPAAPRQHQSSFRPRRFNKIVTSEIQHFFIADFAHDKFSCYHFFSTLIKKATVSIVLSRRRINK